MTRKVIVTDQAQLRGKYGDAGLARVREAVDQLIRADQARGLATDWVALDTAGPWRAKQGNQATFKNAIDHVCGRAKPDYLLILGGPDVVPHQILTNPVDDEDDAVPSDLPYACSGSFAGQAEAFLGPSRVVGRVPDLPEARDPGLLVAQLAHARDWKPRRKSDSGGCFALSALEWKTSTTLSVQAAFGPSARARTSPKQGPAWKPADLAPRMHFINCHGAEVDPQFYGQQADAYPVAHRASQLAGQIAGGTVVAAECCYGAELYDPAGTTPGICVTYLREGAIGFLGSTTIAYGPADTNGEADLVCRYFVEALLKGASLGRALLAARQRFIKRASPLSPVSLKTLAQFLLLGDPSLCAIGGAVAPGTKSFDRSVARHVARRSGLVAKAEKLAVGVDSVASRGEIRAGDGMGQRLIEAARKAGFVPTSVTKTFTVRRAGDATARSALTAKSFRPTYYHLMRAERAESAPGAAKDGPGPGEKTLGSPGPRICKHVILLGREVGGSLVRVERFHAHRSAGPLMTNRFEGLVVRKPFARGSKSEHEAVMLQTGGADLLLRRQGGNAFRDQVLEDLVGHRIRGTGRLAGKTLILAGWEELGSRSSRG